MTLTTNIPAVSSLSPSAIEAVVRSCVEPLRRFATGAEYHRVPAALAAPLSRAAYKALTPSERVLHITAVVRAQVVAGTPGKRDLPPFRAKAALATVKAAPAVEAEARAAVEVAVSVAPARVIPAAAASFFVPCAGQCGQMIPARSGKPVLAFCSSHPAQRRSARMKPNDDGVLVMVRARAKAVCRVTSPQQTK